MWTNCICALTLIPLYACNCACWVYLCVSRIFEILCIRKHRYIFFSLHGLPLPGRLSSVPVSCSFFEQLIHTRVVQFFQELILSLTLLCTFKHKHFFIKILSSSLNTMLIIDKHCCSDVCCDEFSVPQIYRISKQVKVQWHGQFYLQSVQGKTFYCKHRNYQKLWMNNKVWGDKICAICLCFLTHLQKIRTFNFPW